MSITIFGALVAVLGVWCQFGAFPRTVSAMFGLIVLGAVSALDLPALGGASITPANVFLLFFVGRLVSMREGAASLVAEIGPRLPLFPFLLLLGWILGSAVVLPRLFDGATNVFSLARSLDTDTGTVPLHATSGNISQAVYAAGGFAVACATAAYARRPGGARAMLAALMLTTGVHLAFALLDVITAATHTGFVLDVVHTASYAFLTDDELGGLKRISGSFSEASSFATFSVTLLAVNATLFVGRVRPRFTGPASALLAGFIVLATSSAGYAGLGAFAGGFLLVALVLALCGRGRRMVNIALVAGGAGLFVVSLVVLFLPSVATVAQGVIAESLLNKATTDSAVERGTWSAQALQVFRDTYGLGGGIGATRSSNYVLVLLSNLGVIGFGLFVALIGRVTAARLSDALTPEARVLVWAARVGILAALVPNLLIGTVYDLGTLFYGLVGIAASGAATRRSEAVLTNRTVRTTVGAPNASFRTPA